MVILKSGMNPAGIQLQHDYIFLNRYKLKIQGWLAVKPL
jgi:hypothetical protein